MEVDVDVNGKALHGGGRLLPTPPIPELPTPLFLSSPLPYSCAPQWHHGLIKAEKTSKPIQSNCPPLLTAVPHPSAPPLPFP